MMYKTHSVHIDMFFTQKKKAEKKNERMDSHGRFPFAKITMEGDVTGLRLQGLVIRSKMASRHGKLAGCFLVVMAPWGFLVAWLVLGWLLYSTFNGVCFPWEVWPKIYPDPETRFSSEGGREGVKTPEKSMVGSDD